MQSSRPRGIIGRRVRVRGLRGVFQIIAVNFARATRWYLVERGLYDGSTLSFGVKREQLEFVRGNYTDPR